MITKRDTLIDLVEDNPLQLVDRCLDAETRVAELSAALARVEQHQIPDGMTPERLREIANRMDTYPIPITANHDIADLHAWAAEIERQQR